MAETITWSLRRTGAEDAPAIHALRSLPETRRYQPLLPGTVDSLAETLARRGAESLTADLQGKVQWTIVVENQPVGWVTLDVTQRGHHVASVGYAVHPRYHGKGLASGALRQVIDIAFDPGQLALERLEAVAAVENLASRRVLEKCGFRMEGIATGLLLIDGRRVDHARYERLRR